MNQRKIISASEARKLIGDARNKAVEDVTLPFAFEWPAFDGGVFRRIDSEQMNISSGIFRKKAIENAEIEDANFDGSLLRKAAVRNCTFRRAIFGKKLTATWIESEFENVSFEDSHLNYLSIKSCLFRDVRFNGITAKKAFFKDCTFENVVFSGKFLSTNIIGGELNNVDFRDMVFSDSEIDRCKSIHVQYPNNRQNFWISSKLLQQAIPDLTGQVSEKALSALKRFADIFSKDREGLLMDAASLTEMKQVEKDRVMGYLFEASRSGSESR